MSGDDKFEIKKLPTGVPGLDEILGGGLPELSFNLIAGAPGCGKTTLAHQFVFANATPERPALYFTLLGEPALKMLRYQQQFTFFDQAKLNHSVHFINLAQAILEKDLEAVFEQIINEVERVRPAFVVVDSFRAVVRKARGYASELDLEAFIQKLAIFLTSWETTSLLVGEYSEEELANNPVMTIADGIFWLYQMVQRNSVVRKLQVVKSRGGPVIAGLHSIRISEDGIEAFRRTFELSREEREAPGGRRLSTGIPELDAMMGGGIPQSDCVLVAGASGTGKSLLATQFIAEGVRLGEPAVIVAFEERPHEYTARARNFGIDLETPQREGKLKFVYMRPLDLSVDEAMHEILAAVKQTGARRLVIDSLPGFEMALAPGFRTDFREGLYRIVGGLTGADVTILNTVEIVESFIEFPFSKYSVSFLTDDIIRLRYVSIGGRLRKILMVIKMRGGKHSTDIREFEITSNGIKIGERLKDYNALITGIPIFGQTTHQEGDFP